MIRAALFDFGGVILSSPFEAFAAFERERGLPVDFLRTVNATNPDTNAWAALERSEVTLEEFGHRFALESKALGHEVGLSKASASIWRSFCWKFCNMQFTARCC